MAEKFIRVQIIIFEKLTLIDSNKTGTDITDMDKNYAVVNISSYCRAVGQLTVADIKLETLTIDDKAPVLNVVAPKREDDDDGAMSDEEKQAILEDENITQVCFTFQH